MKTGKTRKLDERDKRLIKSTILNLHATTGPLTSTRVQLESGLQHVSNRTVRRYMNELGYHYCRSKKNELMTETDKKLRVGLCRKIYRHKLGVEFWRSGISFYFDGTGFSYKKNPLDQALAPGARGWRMRSEELTVGCTATGNKERNQQAHFMVAIAYGKDAIMCTQYKGRINGPKFADMVLEDFPSAFEQSANAVTKRFFQDGDPRQNSAVARRALNEIGAIIFEIPPRNPDLNPIENFIHLINMELKKDTISRHIQSESFEQFSERVRKIIMEFPSEKIDKITL